jgi:hypothetical protein
LIRDAAPPFLCPADVLNHETRARLPSSSR